jgi:hypothetical protein
MSSQVYVFPTLGGHLGLHIYFMQKRFDREVDPIDALYDMLENRQEDLVRANARLDDKLNICPDCGNIYDGKLNILIEPEIKEGPEFYKRQLNDIEFDASIADENGSRRVKKRIKFSGDFCLRCYRENERVRERSARLFNEDPDRWKNTPYKDFFPEQRFLPRNELIPEKF